MIRPKEILKECKHHGLTDFVLDNKDCYRCRKCRVRDVTKRRRKVKAMLVEYLGGACKLCGYSKCIGALEFHHKNGEKDFGISSKGVTLSYERMKTEVDKCDLLCANCHREIHAIHSGELP